MRLKAVIFFGETTWNLVLKMKVNVCLESLPEVVASSIQTPAACGGGGVPAPLFATSACNH